MKLAGFLEALAALLPGSGQKVEVAENKPLNPFYPGPQLALDVVSFSFIPSRNGKLLTKWSYHF